MQDGTAALYGVDTIVEMTSMPGPKEARSLLERVAGMVRPIMVNRRWTCRRLCEFYPDNPGLLGMNANWGQRISLRLRTPRSDAAFLPFDDILGTMLHELAHMEVGPHNAAFDKLLADLNDEMDSLIGSGQVTYDGQNSLSGVVPFSRSGTRLGASGRRPQPNPHDKRGIRAAAAAAAQARMGRVLGGGPRPGAPRPPLRELARRAAERRATANRTGTCCGETPEEQQGASTAPQPPHAAAAAPAAAPGPGRKRSPPPDRERENRRARLAAAADARAGTLGAGASDSVIDLTGGDDDTAGGGGGSGGARLCPKCAWELSSPLRARCPLCTATLPE